MTLLLGLDLTRHPCLIGSMSTLIVRAISTYPDLHHLYHKDTGKASDGDSVSHWETIKLWAKQYFTS